ncbi:hypothetical protein [Nonomuraea endophytica]|uniref:hypothetical protein n=1 Tax=Nonomuraea endophytica TaxID=714136 RepID=UPI0037C72236
MNGPDIIISATFCVLLILGVRWLRAHTLDGHVDDGPDTWAGLVRLHVATIPPGLPVPCPSPHLAAFPTEQAARQAAGRDDAPIRSCVCGNIHLRPPRRGDANRRAGTQGGRR